MGGSLRGTKKRKPLVLKRKKKRTSAKRQVPRDFSQKNGDIERKLGYLPKWDPTKTLNKNYESIGWKQDINSLRGQDMDASNAVSGSLDEDLRADLEKVRKDGPAPPAKLTTRQRKVVEKLMAKYGDDFKAMQLDQKLNVMQHSAGVLKKMIESATFWKPEDGVDFHSVKRKLWDAVRNG